MLLFSFISLVSDEAPLNRPEALLSNQRNFRGPRRRRRISVLINSASRATVFITVFFAVFIVSRSDLHHGPSSSVVFVRRYSGQHHSQRLEPKLTHIISSEA